MRRLFLLCLGALPAAAAAQGAPEGLVVDYACTGGESLAAGYVNPPGGASYVVLVRDGQLIPMKAGPTGSGVRYLSLDRSKLVWHVKGDRGFLAHDDTDETMIATGCTAMR